MAPRTAALWLGSGVLGISWLEHIGARGKAVGLRAPTA